MTMREVAGKIGKDHSHISMIENSRIRPEDKTILSILVKAFDVPYSQAKDLIALWRVEEALQKAANPKKVINKITIGDNNTIITGDINGNNNTISR